MKVVVQRVSHASVSVAGEQLSAIGAGVLVLLGVTHEDTEKDVDWLVRKVANLRIFDDSEGVMNLSLKDVGGDALVVSQFTLMAATKKGNRPSYIHAAGHDIAVPLYESFCAKLSAELGREVGRGRFGADMQVELLNNGPVTIIIDTAEV
jgi:D-tyrosyl-tRNA(Tyr) deacylase